MQSSRKLSKLERRDSGRGVVKNDRLSKLEDEILLSILSLLTLKEVARTSVLSKRWEHLWRHLPVLHFEDSATMEWMGGRVKPFEKQKSSFVTLVNHVLKKCLSSPIDELKVAFDLDYSYASHIDQWITNAFENQVKRLDLNFEPSGLEWKKYEWLNEKAKLSEGVRYTMPTVESHKLASLTSLHLRNVNVSSEDIKLVFRSCPLLVALCVARSDLVTSVRVPRFPLMLERLEIFYCANIKKFDICAPKLLSLKYDGKPIKLKIRDASLLSEVHIGGLEHLSIAPTYDSLSKYFPKLKYLSLRMALIQQLNLEPSHVSALSTLKHLRLYVYADYNLNLLGWTSLIDACPVLEILTLEFFIMEHKLSMPIVERDGHPLRCLKTLELLGFVGKNIDLELAYYVLDNAINVQQVIVDNRPRPNTNKIKGARRRLRKLKRKIPKGANLILKKVKETY